MPRLGWWALAAGALALVVGAGAGAQGVQRARPTVTVYKTPT
jgi:hypothetical protein